MAIDFSIFQNALPKIAYRAQGVKGQGGALRHFLFGGAPVMGSWDTGLIVADYRRLGVTASEEAQFGSDPNRVTFKTNFNSLALKPAYFNDKEDIDFTNSLRRHFGEELGADSDAVQRILMDVADKRDAMIDAQNLALEKMCAKVLLEGKVSVGVNGDEVQAFPMSNDLLNVSGANLITKPMETLATAVKKVYEKNKNARLKALVMNAVDAINLISKNEKWFDKNTFNIGTTVFAEHDEYGLVLDGRLAIPGAGVVEVYHYLADDLIPQGKALFVPQVVGAIGYGRVLSTDNSLGIGLPEVVEERVTVTPVGEGDYKKLMVARQTSPLPVLQLVDGYCVITGIPNA